MPTPVNRAKYNLKENLKNHFVAYLDVMGFSDLVTGNNTENLDSYFSKITDELNSIKKKSEKIKSVLISDSIILIAPTGLSSLRTLINVIRRIQSALIWRKILIRGAVSYGEIYYNDKDNIIVGKGFIKAYLLEKEANYPRVIIDPSIIKLVSKDKRGFLRLLNGDGEYNFEDRLVYSKSEFSEIKEDGIFIDYANKTVKKDELNGNIKKVYETINDNLYNDQKLFLKYVWLRDYFIETLEVTNSNLEPDSRENKIHKKAISNWIEKFSRL